MHWFYRQLMYTAITTTDCNFLHLSISRPLNFRVKSCQNCSTFTQKCTKFFATWLPMTCRFSVASSWVPHHNSILECLVNVVCRSEIWNWKWVMSITSIWKVRKVCHFFCFFRLMWTFCVNFLRFYSTARNWLRVLMISRELHVAESRREIWRYSWNLAGTQHRWLCRSWYNESKLQTFINS